MDATVTQPSPEWMNTATGSRLGIYFGLSMEDYLADTALGSTDIRLLRRNPTSYWRNSAMNPKRVRKTSDYLERGTGMHTMIFDGEGAFAASYIRGADRTEDMTPAEKAALTKEEKKKAAMHGMTLLPAEDYDRILEARVIIKLNPDMATAFQNGFPEVSVFWVRDGVRRKARIDYLKVLGIGDLKSVSNQYDMDFAECCRLAIARYRYDLQAAHYLEARSMIPEMVERGLANGNLSDSEWQLFRKIVARKEGMGWQWVFYCTDGPPDAMSYKLTHNREQINPMIESAQRDIEIAVARYVRYQKEFGDRQWVLIKPVEELYYDMMPGYFARTTKEELDEYQRWMDSKRGAA